MLSNLKVHLIVLPLIGLLENIAICKVFSSGRPVDATQELIAMGVCNIGNSFVQAFPGSGSLSRSAVNEASGVRTPLGGLYTGNTMPDPRDNAINWCNDEKLDRNRFSKLIKNKIVDKCSKKTLHKRLPVINWMKGYNSSLLVSDMMAGLTVGLTAIPQGIAYAVVAGLEPQYGLYSGFMGCFVYFLLGSVKDITIGPTAIMALMAQKSVESYNSDFAVLLCFLSGCIILLFGILHLGFLVSFISMPVTVGFTTAAAITIASSQLKGLLGIRGKSNEFLESWISVIKHIKETKYEDLCLGLVTIFFLIITKSINDRVSRNLKNQATTTNSAKVNAQIWRLIALGRNAIAVVLGTLAAYLFEINGMKPFRLTGNVEGGLPGFRPPPFSTRVTENNVTRTVRFDEMVNSLGTGIIFVPMISVLETIAIAKAFAKGKILDATQEMIALGASNIAGSFVRSMPTAGSFTRTAVNNASGVKTPLGGLFTGCLILLALELTATFKYIPKATLSAVIISAMFYMIEYHEIILIWNIRKLDILPLFVTILGCLFLGLDYGILIGIFVNLLFILYNSVRPKVTQEEVMALNQEILLIQPKETLTYPGAEYVRELILKASKAKTRTLIVLVGKNVESIDSTIAKNLKTLAEDFEKFNQEFVFWNWPLAAMEACLKLDAKLEKYFQSADTLEELLEGKSQGREDM